MSVCVHVCALVVCSVYIRPLFVCVYMYVREKVICVFECKKKRSPPVHLDCIRSWWSHVLGT